MQAFPQTTVTNLDFVTLYQTHALLVRTIVRRFHFTHATTEDLVQDIFFKVWRSLDKVYNHESIAAWLCVIARNHCLNEVKIQKKRSRHLVSVELIEECKWTNEVDGNQVVSKSEFEEFAVILQDLIASLRDESRREVARLFYVEQKSLRDICMQLNMKQNTALSHLRRFRLIATKTLQIFIEERAAE